MRHSVLSGGGFFAFGGFFSEPIAMCKILLYVESTEIHIAGENDMKRLAWLSVEDYAATQMWLGGNERVSAADAGERSI